MTIKIKFEELPMNKAEISFFGDIVQHNVAYIKESVIGYINKGYKDIILNFKGVEFIDSAGMGLLLGLKSTLRTKKGSLVIRDVKPNIKKIFQHVNFHKILNIE